MTLGTALESKDPNKALTYYKEALNVYEKDYTNTTKQDKAYTLTHIGKLLDEIGNDKEAIENYKRALEIAKGPRDPHNHISAKILYLMVKVFFFILIYLGNALCKIKKYKKCRILYG